MFTTFLSRCFVLILNLHIWRWDEKGGVLLPVHEQDQGCFTEDENTRGAAEIASGPIPAAPDGAAALPHTTLLVPPTPRRSGGRLLYFKVGELSVVVVSSPKIAKQVLKNHDACASRPKTVVTQVISYDYTDVVTSPYGEYRKQMRNICIAELLGAKNVRSFEHLRKEQGSILGDQIRSRSSRGAPFNLTDKIVWFMYTMTCRAVFGDVSMDTSAAMAAAGHLELADLFPSIKLLHLFSWKAHHLSRMKPEMDRILDDIIDNHRNNPPELGTGDFVDILLRFKESEDLEFPMTDDAIKAVIVDMFAGGTESALSAVDWTMVELVRNPRVMAKAQAEIRRGRGTIQEVEIRNLKYLKLVVKESMRLHPPNVMIPRSCSEDVEVEGYHIPRDAAIVVNVWRLGRDPAYWREPERFEGSSVDFMGNHLEYIPFGAWKRTCPGIAFTVANVEFVLAQLLYHFDWELPPGIAAEDMDMTESGSFAVSRKSSLHLIATPLRSGSTPRRLRCIVLQPLLLLSMFSISVICL